MKKNLKSDNYLKIFIPVTGGYRVPDDGLYLVHARVLCKDDDARHHIRVDNVPVTYTATKIPGEDYLSASTSVVLQLQSGQEVVVTHFSCGTIHGKNNVMLTSFGAALIYEDSLP